MMDIKAMLSNGIFARTRRYPKSSPKRNPSAALTFLASALVFATGSSFGAQATNSTTNNLRMYVFGNSLIYHADPHANIAYWLNALAKADGNKLALSGQFGFLRDFVTKGLPPIDGWKKFRDVPRSWIRGQTSFEKADLNTIMINPSNFSQYQSILKYGEKSPGSLLGDTLYLFDWVKQRHPRIKFYIYEGWADMGAMHIKGRWHKVDDFPPSAKMLSMYHTYNGEEYHDWYIDYLKQVRTRRPDLNVELIPVAKVLSKLFLDTELYKLSATDLYEDNAPHGTPTTYFLAALITYSALYKSQAPAAYQPHAKLHDLVRRNYRNITQVVCAELNLGAACK